MTTMGRPRPPRSNIRRQRRPSISRGAILLQRLISDASPSFSAWHIEEPKLIFAGQQRSEDPKTGLALFGPRQLDQLSRDSIRIGIIGTGETIQLTKAWLASAVTRIGAGRNKQGIGYDPLLFPDFPGFSEHPPFQCRIDADMPSDPITEREIEKAVDTGSFSQRIRNILELVGQRLGAFADKDPEPDVVICAMPNTVDIACGPQGRVKRGRPKPLTGEQKTLQRLRDKAAKSGQLLLTFLQPGEDEVADREHWDFHNALKVQAMKSKLPTQLIWENTLRGRRDSQDPATIAWNFFTALYYKSGNIPWELDFPTGGTCFVGVTFYRENPTPQALTRTSLAQVFSETGEGLVLKGEPVQWDKDRDRKPHLSFEAAQALLHKAIGLYQSHFHTAPRRVVVHKTSRYWPEELKGFEAGLGDIRSYDFLSLERRGIRFLRLGYEPPVRGTVVELAKRNYLVYTRGYIPYLRCYPGMRVPNPLEVVEHHGDSSAEKVCSEILALTKLNWNNCGFGGGDPITISFSKQVGRILTELPSDQLPLSKFKYYM